MDDCKLLQESNLTARQPRRAPRHVTQATTIEELAQRPYVATSVGFESAAFGMQGTEPTTELPLLSHLKLVLFGRIVVGSASKQSPCGSAMQILAMNEYSVFFFLCCLQAAVLEAQQALTKHKEVLKGCNREISDRQAEQKRMHKDCNNAELELKELDHKLNKCGKDSKEAARQV